MTPTTPTPATPTPPKIDMAFVRQNAIVLAESLAELAKGRAAEDPIVKARSAALEVVEQIARAVTESNNTRM